MKMYLIDVSHWQGTINFNTVKNSGVEGVIIKAGGWKNGAGYADPKFATYYADAKNAGLHVGTYYYTSEAFCSAAQGRREAAHFLSLLAGKQFDLPLWADVEEVKTTAGKAAITEATAAFCDYVEQHPISGTASTHNFCGVYGSDQSGFVQRMDQSKLKAYAKWVARYSTTPPKYVSTYGMWQFGGSINYLKSPKVAGVSSAACDQSYCYVDYPSIIMNGGFNGYKAPTADNASESTAKAETDAGTVTVEAAPKNALFDCTLRVSIGDKARIAALAADLGVEMKVVNV